MTLTFESVGHILRCDHSNENSLPVLTQGAICFTKFHEMKFQKFHNDDVSLPDLGRAFDWLKQISHAARPIRSTTQILVVIRHQYGISALVPQMSFRGETSCGVAK